VNKIARFIHNYLLIGLPFVITCMIWETIEPEIEFGNNAAFLTKILWELLSYNLMLWFVTLILFLICLVMIPDIREKTLRRLANLRERDEREQYITGIASRAAYISTLSMMILFLFFSMFSLRITTIPNNQTMSDRHHLRAGIGLHFSLLNKDRAEVVGSKNPEGKVIFDSSDISLSTSATMLLLLGWQLLAFNYAARKEQIKDM